ncbi:MAG: 23S rRNA (guanosine(2251)-2'-O)-methyltransferase RlmB [Chlamydiales bacterium]
MSKRFRLIMGKNCIQEVLKASPDRVVRVFTAQKDVKDPLLKSLRQHAIPITIKIKQDLNQMVKSESHQNFVAEIKEKHQPTLEEFLKHQDNKSQSLVLMLDSVYDPQNIGAILRSAECFGVDLVIFSKNRGGDITPIVSKVSCGASELLPILKVANLADTMAKLQKEGFWVVCAHGAEDSTPINDFSFPEKTLLIVGSEGEGIQPLIRKKADFNVSIPMYGQIDSLNVSQATSLFLFSYRQNKK